jgi:predicted nucleic acid-binding protein
VPAIALDTNILVYSEGLERSATDRAKVNQSQALLEALSLSGEDWVIPAQALAELHSVLVRRDGQTPKRASATVNRLALLCEVASTSPSVLGAALELSGGHHLQIYDAVILAAAAEAGCDLLLSEDMHDGFAWRGVTVTNPFGPAPDRRIVRLLSAGL